MSADNYETLCREAVFAVEASDIEYDALREDNALRYRKVRWESLGDRYYVQVGESAEQQVAVRPVCLDGVVGFFYRATSKAVVWSSVLTWLQRDFPQAKQFTAENFDVCVGMITNQDHWCNGLKGDKMNQAKLPVASYDECCQGGPKSYGKCHGCTRGARSDAPLIPMTESLGIKPISGDK